MAYKSLDGQGEEGTDIRLGTKPVIITRYEPKERTF
jgi:succinate dehydrogenase / fumarate reductase flavoprotein subunit